MAKKGLIKWTLVYAVIYGLVAVMLYLLRD